MDSKISVKSASLCNQYYLILPACTRNMQELLCIYLACKCFSPLYVQSDCMPSTLAVTIVGYTAAVFRSC